MDRIKTAGKSRHALLIALEDIVHALSAQDEEREKQANLSPGSSNAPEESRWSTYERRLEALKKTGRWQRWHALDH